MDRKPLVPFIFIVFAGLLFGLQRIVPQPVFPLFEQLHLGGRSASKTEGGPDVRAKAALPAPRRYIEACRSEAARRMARPDWAGLGREDREAALTQVLILCGADAEYWTMSEAHQKRVAREFAEAFLAPPARPLVDK
ncbi:hypothetical protein [Desulfovibrio sp. TomC]|uniref:hypothetical protein n=1 Tax=Desulfovibrio sp. TomC TaxID=1562888 RepID=UPI0005756C11|nr:hypothetical protein [Desulfovibrio sp. TomC]KHK01185.1 hypothetical protein NY78_3378 [Desulfovibrio sp. TomC]